MQQQKITFLLPKMTVTEMETFIDGVSIRNRTQLIHMAINEWMERNRQKGKQLDITQQKKYKNKRVNNANKGK